jgi:hypothetical protein
MSESEGPLAEIGTVNVVDGAACIGKDPRLFRANTDVAFGERAPSTMQSSSRDTTQSYVVPDVATTWVDAPSLGWSPLSLGLSALAVASVVGTLYLGRQSAQLLRTETERRQRLMLLGIQFLVLGCIALYDYTEHGGVSLAGISSAATLSFVPHAIWSAVMFHRDDEPKRTRCAAGLGVALLVFGVASGFAAGSPLVLDNATEHSLAVYVDGQHYANLPSHYFARTRLAGGEHELSFRVEWPESRLIEKVRVNGDADLRSLILRAAFGRGTLLYNVCGANHYRRMVAYYGKH